MYFSATSYANITTCDRSLSKASTFKVFLFSSSVAVVYLAVRGFQTKVLHDDDDQHMDDHKLSTNRDCLGLPGVDTKLCHFHCLLIIVGRIVSTADV